MRIANTFFKAWIIGVVSKRIDVVGISARQSCLANARSAMNRLWFIWSHRRCAFTHRSERWQARSRPTLKFIASISTRIGAEAFVWYGAIESTHELGAPTS